MCMCMVCAYVHTGVCVYSTHFKSIKYIYLRRSKCIFYLSIVCLMITVYHFIYNWVFFISSPIFDVLCTASLHICYKPFNVLLFWLTLLSFK